MLSRLLFFYVSAIWVAWTILRSAGSGGLSRSTTAADRIHVGGGRMPSSQWIEFVMKSWITKLARYWLRIDIWKAWMVWTPSGTLVSERMHPHLIMTYNYVDSTSNVHRVDVLRSSETTVQARGDSDMVGGNAIASLCDKSNACPHLIVTITLMILFDPTLSLGICSREGGIIPSTNLRANMILLDQLFWTLSIQ